MLALLVAAQDAVFAGAHSFDQTADAVVVLEDLSPDRGDAFGKCLTEGVTHGGPDYAEPEKFLSEQQMGDRAGIVGPTGLPQRDEAAEFALARDAPRPVRGVVLSRELLLDVGVPRLGTQIVEHAASERLKPTPDAGPGVGGERTNQLHAPWGAHHSGFDLGRAEIKTQYLWFGEGAGDEQAATVWGRVLSRKRHPAPLPLHWPVYHGFAVDK